MKDNFHIGCILFFIAGVVLFIMYSVPILKQQNAQEQNKLTDTELTRVWEIVDSVKHEELMDEPNYVTLYEENKELKDRLQRIKEYAEEMEDCLLNFEQKGFDVSELQDAIVNITSECE